MLNRPEISLIIPVKDERESLEQLVKEIYQGCSPLNKSFEIIFVDDGSVDGSFVLLENLRKKDRRIKLFRLRKNFGKSTALMVGFEKAQGEIQITLDGDLQDNPIEIPRFVQKLNQGYDVVSGWKKKRLDPLSKTVPSKIFNLLTAKLTKIKIHDFNCGFKAYRKEVTKKLNLYGELYRFIPVLVGQKGYRVGEITIRHRKRKYGKSKYGKTRLIRGVLDLITVIFLTGFSLRPGHFFGSLGILFFIPGFLIGLYITYLRITTGGIGFHYPLLFLGVLFIIVGIQFISTGLLAEMLLSSKGKSDTEDLISKKT